MPRAQEAFRSEDEHWFVTEKKFYRVVRSQRPAVITFSYVDRPELVEDFLKPASAGATAGAARFRYRDRTGASRTFDWALEGQEGKSIMLPDSDLNVLLEKATDFPTNTPQRPRSINTWGTTRFRSPSSRSNPARTSRLPI